MRDRVLALTAEVDSLLRSALLVRDGSPYASLLRNECREILGEAIEDLDRRLPEARLTIEELEFARDALAEHLRGLRHLVN